MNSEILQIKTIGNYDKGRDNNYNLLRFIAAVLVIYSHSHPLSGIQQDPLLLATGHTDLGTVGVSIFFVISGFLVTKSFIMRKNLLIFMEARLLRILPGLSVAVLFSAFVVGVFVTNTPLQSYLTSWETFSYVLRNISLMKVYYYLPGVFVNNPYSRVVNGSLWTLPQEIRMYILVAFFGGLGILARKNIFNFAMLTCILIFILFQNNFPILSDNTKYIKLASHFAFGAFCYINRSVIPVHFSILGILLTAAVLLHNTHYSLLLLNMALSYGVIWFAYYPSDVIRRFNLFGDISYGLYIYAFPIQQTIVYISGNILPIQIFALSLPLTMIPAMLSWYFIEKPALSLKGRIFHKTKKAFADVG